MVVIENRCPGVGEKKKNMAGPTLRRLWGRVTREGHNRGRKHRHVKYAVYPPPPVLPVSLFLSRVAGTVEGNAGWRMVGRFVGVGW